MALVDRVKNLLLAPKAEWAAIAAEPVDIVGLFRGYVLPMAAIPPVCGLLGGLVFLRHYPFSVALTDAVAGYVRSLIVVSLMGLFIAKMAPRFGGTESLVGGLKVAAYSATAAWAAGVLLLLPQLQPIHALIGFYGLYLLYLGLPIVTGSADSSTPAFTLVTIVVAFLVYAVVKTILETALATP